VSEYPAIPADIASAVKLVVLDVDGVMTDGGVYYGATKAGDTVELKRFEITDGLGVHLMQEAGIEVAIVTGRRSKVVELRARELAIEEVHQDPAAEKLPIVSGILLRRKIDWSEGAGAVREFAEALLKARGDWTTVVDGYLAKRDPESTKGAGRGPA
jgi:3-deoxy-D-manno-octulosonate 8-phosphate phosphatase (KDO 8-P phosphatase)